MIATFPLETMKEKDFSLAQRHVSVKAGENAQEKGSLASIRRCKNGRCIKKCTQSKYICRDLKERVDECEYSIP